MYTFIFSLAIIYSSLTDAGFTPESRAFSPAVVQQISQLKNYGCWCYFDDENSMKINGLGKSKPVDEIDTFCKQLHNNYNAFEHVDVWR